MNATELLDSFFGAFREENLAGVFSKLDRLVDEYAKELEADCKECGGTEGKHYLNCSIWKN